MAVISMLTFKNKENERKKIYFNNADNGCVWTDLHCLFKGR